MIRVTIKKQKRWGYIFSLASIFEKYLKLSKYDAMKLAYTTQTHDVLIQGSNKDSFLWLLQIKLLKLGITAEVKEVESSLDVQIDLNKFELQSLGISYKDKRLWKSNTDLLIFREIRK